MTEYISFFGEGIDSDRVMDRASYDRASGFIEEYLADSEGRALVRRYQDANRTPGEKRLALKELVEGGRMPSFDDFKEAQSIVHRRGCKYVEPGEGVKSKVAALRAADALTPQIVDGYRQDSARELESLRKSWNEVVFDWIPMFEALQSNRDLFMTDEEKASAASALDKELEWESAKARAKEHYGSLGSLEERIAFARRHPDFFPEFQ